MDVAKSFTGLLKKHNPFIATIAFFHTPTLLLLILIAHPFLSYSANPIITHMRTADPSAHIWADGKVWLYCSHDMDSATDYSTMDGYHKRPPGAQDHHSFIEYQGKWYYFYHVGNYTASGIKGSANRRNVCIDEMFFNSDGTIKRPAVTLAGSRQAAFATIAV